MDSLQSAPPVDTVAVDNMSNVDILSRPGPRGGQNTTTTLHASSDRPDPPTDAPTGSLDVLARQEKANKDRH